MARNTRTVAERSKISRFQKPIAAGVALGFGAPLLFAGLIEFFGVILPKFFSFYVP